MGHAGHSGPRIPALLSPQGQDGEAEENHAQFLKALQNAVTTFVNRMKSNHVRGRSVINDSAVLSLFQSINAMHPQLLELLNQLDERRRTCGTRDGHTQLVYCRQACQRQSWAQHTQPAGLDGLRDTYTLGQPQCPALTPHCPFPCSIL